MKRRMLLSAIGSNAPVSLEIEGSLSAYNTKAKVATLLGVSESKIRYYTNSGTFMQVSLRGGYNIPSNQFYNNTTFTKFRDIRGVVEIAHQNCFRNTALTELLLPRVKTNGLASLAYNNNLTILELPELINLGTQSFRNNSSLKIILMPRLEQIITKGSMFGDCSSLELLDMKKLKTYDIPSIGYAATASGFSNLKTGCVININIALKTANSGAVDEAFRYAKNIRGAIVNFYDDNGNYVSTL